MKPQLDASRLDKRCQFNVSNHSQFSAASRRASIEVAVVHSKAGNVCEVEASVRLLSRWTASCVEILVELLAAVVAEHIKTTADLLTGRSVNCNDFAATHSLHLTWSTDTTLRDTRNAPTIIDHSRIPHLFYAIQLRQQRCKIPAKMSVATARSRGVQSVLY